MTRRVWAKSIWDRANGCGFNYRPAELSAALAAGITAIRCVKCGAEWKPDADATRPRKCKGDGE